MEYSLTVLYGEPVWSSVSRGVDNGDWNCRFVKSGNEPVLLAMEMCTMLGSCSVGYILNKNEKGVRQLINESDVVEEDGRNSRWCQAVH